MLARLANKQPESTTFAPYSAAEGIRETRKQHSRLPYCHRAPALEGPTHVHSLARAKSQAKSREMYH